MAEIINDELMTVLNNFSNEVTINNLYDLYTVYNQLGFEDIDTLVLNEIVEEDTCDINNTIKRKSANAGVAILENLGIGIETDDIVTLTNVLLVVSLMKLGNKEVSDLLLSIMHDEEKSTVEILAAMVSTITTTDYFTALEAITYFKDIYYVSYKEYLQTLTDEEEIDDESYEEEFNLLQGLMDADPEVIKTDSVRRLVRGLGVYEHIDEYLKLEEDADVLAIDLSIGLYISEETKDNPLAGFKEYLVETGYLEDNNIDPERVMLFLNKWMKND